MYSSSWCADLKKCRQYRTSYGTPVADAEVSWPPAVPAGVSYASVDTLDLSDVNTWEGAQVLTLHTTMGLPRTLLLSIRLDRNTNRYPTSFEYLVSGGKD